MSNAVIRNPQSRSALILAGAGLILVTGLIHLVLIPEHFGEAPYLGLLFIADFIGAVVAAFGIYRGHRWGWLLGTLVAGGALVAYFVSGTVGLPGMERGHLLEPLGIFTKAIEALFLVLCGVEFTRSLRGLRRWALVGGIAAALVVVPGVALALGPQDAHPGHGQAKGAGLPVRWAATSPAIHLGDKYDLVMTNTGDKDQKAWVRTMIMDHRAHENTMVIDEPLNLAPGEERELTAVNDYGEANHFQTGMGSQTKDLNFTVKVTDSKGNETARFNQEAFRIQEKQQKAGGKTNGG
jgi:hypothetical protein